MFKKYKSKERVEAVQVTRQNLSELIKLASTKDTTAIPLYNSRDKIKGFSLLATDYGYEVYIGEFLVRDPDGFFYPLDKDYFLHTYEETDGES